MGALEKQRREQQKQNQWWEKRWENVSWCPEGYEAVKEGGVSGSSNFGSPAKKIIFRSASPEKSTTDRRGRAASPEKHSNQVYPSDSNHKADERSRSPYKHFSARTRFTESSVSPAKSRFTSPEKHIPVWHGPFTYEQSFPQKKTSGFPSILSKDTTASKDTAQSVEESASLCSGPSKSSTAPTNMKGDISQSEEDGSSGSEWNDPATRGYLEKMVCSYFEEPKSTLILDPRANNSCVM